MQILAIVLYHRDGKRVHELDFAPGKINIVTGISDTGKSAVLEIVDYCLGSGSHGIYRGRELETIGWYGLRLTVAGQPIFVARERPATPQKVSDRAMLVVGTEGARAPEHVAQTTNIDTVTAELGAMLGISENLHQPPEGSSRAPLTAGLRHAMAYALQRQRLIADPKYLFAGQEDNFKEQAIRDTLPFFLGAVDQDALQQRRELRKRRSELRAIEARLADAEGRMTAVTARLALLLEDARENALVDTAAELPPDEARSVLAQAVDQPPDDTGLTMTGDPAQIAGLQDRKTELGDELRELRAERRALIDRRRLAHDFASEAGEHRARLLTLDLLPHDAPASGACPLCGAPPGDHEPAAAELRAELERAQAQAEASATAEPQLESAIEELDRRIEELRGRLEAADHELQSLVQRDNLALRARGRLQQQAYIRGRIAGFLEEHPAVEPAELHQLGESADVAAARVSALEEGLSADVTRARTENALAYVGEDMTNMAKALRLSYATDGVRLDPVALTVVGRDPNGPVWLNQDIGSGKNWVGYHVVTLLAMHRHFVEHTRPVPRVLLLDQPTQAFFPSEKRNEKDRKLSDLRDEDQAQVRRIFELIRKSVADLDGAMQVIVMDHAEIDEPWFTEAVGENNWRDGRGLVPRDWFMNAS
jgi:ABC-type iron transport system FetAB ATPase subunit